MRALPTLLGLLATTSVLGVSPAAAAEFEAGRDCRGTNLGTCASVHGAMAGGELSFGVPHLNGAQGRSSYTVRLADRTVGFGPDAGLTNAAGRAACHAAGGAVRGEADCAHLTVVPEPVSMTLVATGLPGLMGVSWRKKRGVEV